LEQVHGVNAGPIFEMNATLRKDFLHRFDELVDKGIQLLSWGAGLTSAEVERVAQILLIISTGIEIHRQQVLGRNTGTCGIELYLAYWDPRTIRTKIPEAEDASAVRYTNETNIPLRPVLQDFLHFAAVFDREIHSACLAIDVPELKTGFANRGIVDDRKESRWIGHDRPIEKRLVMVEQINEIDVTI